MCQTARVVRSSCRGCHGVCQVLVHIEGGRIVKVAGDPDSPTSRGYICPKGTAAPEVLYHKDRLTHPLKRAGTRGENRWKRISWDQAISEIAERLDRVRSESGTEYFAMAQGTGRPYTEYTNRFAQAFGTPNFISPGHNCFLPRVIASGITAGTLPIADIYGFGGVMPACVMNWGCNHAETGAADGMCGAMFKRAFLQARKKIVIDPRRTGLARDADYWLQIRPGSECALALAMIHVIIGEDLYDHEFVEKYGFGFERLADHVRPFTPEWAHPLTRLPASLIAEVARTFATTKPACIQWGNGIDMSTNAFQTARAILILMGITGNIDAPGGNVFWVPPKDIRPKQHKLAAGKGGPGLSAAPERKGAVISGDRFPFTPDCHTPTFWKSVVTGEPYRVRALWIVGSNPLLTATNGVTIERALKDFMEYTVVSDLFMTPTAQLADLVLPAAHWLEQDDIVFMHEVWCAMTRKKLARIGEARDDRDVILEVAHRLGLHDAFPWPDRYAYLDWLCEGTGMRFEEFKEKDIVVGQMRYRKHEQLGFLTPSRKFEFYSTIMEHAGRPPMPVYVEPPLSPLSAPEYPLILITGAKKLHYFHSELHQIDSLRALHPDPVVEINPETATRFRISHGDWVWVESPYGKVKLRAKLFDGIAPDVVSAEHAWWYPEAAPPDYRWKESSVNLLFGDDHFDPDSGAEPLKCYVCRVTPI
jgi:anaerobic selenocysteine-containing dehydrogenase